jgi:hypothetical protein
MFNITRIHQLGNDVEATQLGSMFWGYERGSKVQPSGHEHVDWLYGAVLVGGLG